MFATSRPTACLFSLLLLALPGVAQDTADDVAQAKEADLGIDSRYQYVQMSTTLGDMVIELDHKSAPVTVENFLRYAEDDFYSGTIFHRVMDNFMIQGGGFTEEFEKKSTRPEIKNEAANGLKNDYGTIAMARTNMPHSATAQFFINCVNNDFLNHREPVGAGWGYAVFGKVIEGIETLEKIRVTPTQPEPRVSNQPAPLKAVIIKSVKRIDPKSCEAAIGKARKAEAEVAAVEFKAAQEGAERAAQLASLTEELGDAGLALVAFRGHDVERGHTTESGLWVLDLVPGSGSSPSTTDTVRVHYEGWLTDGTKFDSSVDRGEPTEFPLNRVIAGWTEGVSGMMVGGKRYMVVPHELGYGEQGFGNVIPPRATLVFEVELLEIKS